jgi:hypothetical protein
LNSQEKVEETFVEGMFRYTITFLLIFLLVNHDFAAAREAKLVMKPPSKTGVQKRDVIEETVEGIICHILYVICKRLNNN